MDTCLLTTVPRYYGIQRSRGKSNSQTTTDRDQPEAYAESAKTQSEVGAVYSARVFVFSHLSMSRRALLLFLAAALVIALLVTDADGKLRILADVAGPGL